MCVDDHADEGDLAFRIRRGRREKCRCNSSLRHMLEYLI